MDDTTTEIEVSPSDPKVQAALIAVKGLGTMFAITAAVVAGIAAKKEFSKTVEALVKTKLESQ